MHRAHLAFRLLFFVAMQTSAFAVAVEPNPGKPNPIADEIFLQEVGHKIPSDMPLTSITAANNTVYAGTSKGLLRLTGKRLEAVPELKSPVIRLVATKDAIWAVTPTGL